MHNSQLRVRITGFDQVYWTVASFTVESEPTPGLQLYTGNQLNGSVAGGEGIYRQSAGFAFEPQGFPDAPWSPQAIARAARDGAEVFFSASGAIVAGGRRVAGARWSLVSLIKTTRRDAALP